MPPDAALTKTEIAEWLKASGTDREWLADQLKVSLSIVHQWMAPKGTIPEDRLVSIRRLMAQEAETTLIGDPEGNLVSFTLDEFERIEATRQRLHYDTRPPMYRDAILAFIEADEASHGKILPLSPSPPASLSEALRAGPSPQVSPASIAAESPAAPPVSEPRRPVTYTKPKRPR